MKKLRILVVEDSLTVRKRLCEILATDPGIEVVGEAEDGSQAIALCLQLRPDAITMDMMLPVMSGLAATEYIMAHCPTPILVVSASTNRGELFKTYDALAAGAVDVLEKPLGDASDAAWEAHFIATLKLVSRIRVVTHHRARLRAAQHPPQPLAPMPLPPAGRNYQLVAIGASTGGPGAVVQVLQSLPADFRLPILLVLHINEPFGTAFADWLDGQTGRRVAYAQEGEPVAAAAGRVAMAPPNQHLTVQGGRFHLTHGAERNFCRPSVDVLFESLAQTCGATTIACLLTGMGRDGAAGLLAIRQAGGLTIAQDEESSVVYGMPREAALLGAACHVLSLRSIGPALVSLHAPGGGVQR
jgi:two-component system, chemotaxis family, protein-glutamate methylesterase/glutaminase